MNLKNITYKQIVFYMSLAVLVIGSLLFVNNNHSFYDRPIAKVLEADLEEATDVVDAYGNEDRLFTQSIEAEIKNGAEKNHSIHLINEYSSSGAFDQAYKEGDELFVWIDEEAGKDEELTGTIQDVKRDKHILPIVWIFIFILLLIGKRQGFFSIISLLLNAAILSYALDIYVENSDIGLLIICGVTVVLFTITSLLLINGFNEKTYAAIIATLLGTFISFFITYAVLWMTGENGLRYEAIDFLSRPFKPVFLAGLLIGSLGAVMDVAITMSSSVFEMYENNHAIDNKTLKQSGLHIGRDIMGTMTNILFFAYISGSIPMLLLFLKNESLWGFTLSLNLSLELARALAGGIGIVLAIPIGLYISIFFVNRKRGRV
ncbi:YibE/F family protein [Oceanobacillus alkalisoli]|uniref:YibE/F family protein n=1 Tax=Oceanobacillus alkalisoli TaxID=2925113 RepID=UPI001EE4E086|nr:YibE/F family protein [Oceanobacillus alkalisoli]MCG5103750.1 YibE/F family protein [Oceanobacillus alkalisoli]